MIRRFKKIGELLSVIEETWAARSVLRQLIRQQLILRYRRTLLGYLWTLVNPLLMMSVMAVVFSSLFKSDLKGFAVFLFAGMIPWNFFNAVVTQSGGAYIQNEGLIKKVYIPKIVFPLGISIACLVDSVLAFVALFFIIFVMGGGVTWSIFFLPFAYILLFLFCLGISLLMAVVTVFFRDMQYLIVIAMQGLFFLTPILYKPEELSGRVGRLVDLNPFVPFIHLFRNPLYEGCLPDALVIMTALLLSLVSMVIGSTVYMWQRKNIVFRL